MRIRLVLAAGLSVLATSPARAADTVSFALASPVRTVTAAGGTLAFDATVSAPASNTGSTNLNGLSFSIAGANAFTIDESAFFDDVPFFLDPGDSYAGPLFSIVVPANSVAQQYFGFVALLGGPSFESQDTLGTATFAIAVQAAPTASAVPEGAAWGLMLLGFGVAGAALRGRRRIGAQVAYAT